MKIQIPKTFMGEPIEGASERYLKGQKTSPPSVPSVTLPAPARNLTDPENYLILPGRSQGSYAYPDLLVAKDRSHPGKNWNDCHAELHKENFSMLTIRQFVDFISELKSGKIYNGQGTKISQTQIDALLEDILTQREPYRAEWLDADFKLVNKILHINYNHRTLNGQLTPQKSEPLEKCLMEDSYAELLGSTNAQGLPTKKAKSGLYFYFPRSDNNSVAGFWADSDWVFLYCNWGPAYSDSGLGVRRAREK